MYNQFTTGHGYNDISTKKKLSLFLHFKAVMRTKNFHYKWKGSHILKKVSACFFSEDSNTASHRYVKTAVVTISVNSLCYSKPLQAVCTLGANFNVTVELS